MPNCADIAAADHARRRALAMRRYRAGAASCAAVALVDAVWLHAGGYALQWSGVAVAARAIAVCAAFSLVLRGVARVPRYASVAARFRYGEAARTFAWLALLAAFVAAAGILSYLCVTLKPPLIDGALIRLDARLGFDWPAVYERIRAHPALQRALAFAYDSAQWQLIGIPVWLGLTRRDDDLSEFIALFMLTSVMVLLISTPFPAASAFLHFRVADPIALAGVSDFVRLRDGTLRVIDPAALQGMVSMPSFHTVLGVLFAYALRRGRVVAPLALLFNGWMIASTPTQGGHYFVDVLAGLLVACAAIAALRYAADARAGTGDTARSGRPRPSMAGPAADGEAAFSARAARASRPSGDA
ncbi:PAP2 superfamily protein [Burkholderia pseudomallei TSV 25]|uniref:phosphatase PAP2 family protein n=1 Tax=Burkholderia pseudomallei TaxID=28450 RepID=UPI00050F9CD9|nr:phosphatase PAP2 family protein [Burkholderia pseudomallei]AIV49429.1 PAP2 superfamily protein [Burkholderia pseudomallei TSV 48]KGC16105.1 PAP2 superfamily protein [Burkholderia pseudomallei]KGW10678.1 PAP2 superfamily protein [Burkholderia pseudomallei TSV 25]KIX60357.1 phosphoesterase [Burkholderia pseudomallei]CAK0230807.1 PAP2 family protein [Burkholderia pseudomallei]